MALARIAACAAAIAMTACTSAPGSHSTTGSSRNEPRPPDHASSGPVAGVYASKSAHLYRGSERFCLRSPVSGTAKYSVHAGTPSIILDIHGLPPKTGVGLDWINNAARGYMIGAFTTDASGSYVGAARMFRLGEVRAVAIRFERSDGTGLPGAGKPCAG